MKVLSISLGFFTASIFPYYAYSDQLSEQKLSSLLLPINGFSADFSQQLSTQDGDIFQRSSGSLSALKPNLLRWIVAEPLAQEMIRNGQRLWIYDPDLQQVVIQPYSESPSSSPISLFLGDSQQLSNHFEVVAQTVNSQSHQIFELKTVNPNALYTNLKIEFDGPQPKEISFTDSLGQITVLTLSEVKVNPIFTSSDFTFDIPEGVDIVNYVN